MSIFIKHLSPAYSKAEGSCSVSRNLSEDQRFGRERKGEKEGKRERECVVLKIGLFIRDTESEKSLKHSDFSRFLNEDTDTESIP